MRIHDNGPADDSQHTDGGTDREFVRRARDVEPVTERQHQQAKERTGTEHGRQRLAKTRDVAGEAQQAPYAPAQKQQVQHQAADQRASGLVHGHGQQTLPQDIHRGGEQQQNAGVGQVIRATAAQYDLEEDVKDREHHPEALQPGSVVTKVNDPLHFPFMPVFDLSHVLVDQQSRLDAVCSGIAAGDLVAIDTEFVRTTQFSPRLCLVQIAAGDQAYCIDELAGLDTRPLWDLLCAGQGLRVLHAAKQDLEVAWVRYQRLPSPLFDTQIAAALVGQPAQVGYAGLVKTLLDIDVDKTHTRADWSLRPLAPALIAYGAADVVHLPVVYALLREQLEKLGRHTWALEDSARLVDPALYIVDPGEAWRRLPGIPRMPVPAQLRARRLASWREEYALRADRPRQWILTDKSLLDIAMRRPRNETELAGCTEVPPGVARRQGEAILAELDAAALDFENGTDLVQEMRPELVNPEHMKRLGRVVEEIAKSLAISPELLATRKDLTAAIRGEQQIRPLSGWRRPIIGEPLLAAVNAL